MRISQSWILGVVLSGLWMCSVQAEELTTSFPKGSGSKFQFTLQPGNASVELVVSVADASRDRVAVEYYFNAGAPIPLELWQQYVLSVHGSSVKVLEGYVYASQLKGPERVPARVLEGADGVAMSDFLFQGADTAGVRKVGDESVTVPAGTVSCVHYHTERNGQVIDFWISDASRPIGLVKLTSRGAKQGQSYDVALVSLVKNVAPRIDRTQAGPSTVQGARLFGFPQR